jgi:glycosyltransferase involved in cell wall biosynthesis
MRDAATRAVAVDAVHRPLVMVIGARGIPDVEGGAEKNAEMLFPIIAQAGYRVVLFGLDGLIKGTHYRGVELQKAPNRRVFNTDKLFYYFYAIRKAMALRPDIVHLQGLGASLFLWAYKLFGARVVVRYGSADYEVDKWGRIGKAGFRMAEYQTRFADAVIAVAPALADRLARQGIRRNVHLIANAVDHPITEDQVPPPGKGEDGSPFALLVGRVTAQKNVDNLIRGFRRFVERTGSPAKLLIAGGLQDVAYVESLKPLLNDRIVLLGRCTRSELEGLYHRCGVFVNGSVHEGSSNAVLEAISRNCPIILSGIPENKDFGLQDHIFFEPEDIDSIADKFEDAFADKQSYQVDRNQFMTWSTVGEKTLAVYHAILTK